MTEQRIDADWLIGDVLDGFPETLPVFEKHFGEICLTCRGALLETIEFGSVIHGLDVDVVVDDLNKCIACAKANQKIED